MIEKQYPVQSGEELSKRTYLGGVTYTHTCSECGTEITRDFGDEYLSYPQTGVYKSIHIYCDSCDKEFLDVAQIKVDIIATIKETNNDNVTPSTD